jgi:hypothetical protein
MTEFRTRIKVLHDAMNDDKDVIPVNFTVVGKILLEFFYALSDHMGWSRRIQKHKAERHSKRENAAANISTKLRCWHENCAQMLLSIDKGTTEQSEPEHDIGEVAAFTKSFFRDGRQNSL